MRKRCLAFLFAALLAFAGAGHAQEILAPLILVAKPELRDKLYGASVLVVTPLGDDQHVEDPLYLGGPMGSQLIFALVQRPESPGGKSLPVMPGLYVALDAETGAWFVLPPDPALVMRKPEGLWEELVRRSQQAGSTI